MFGKSTITYVTMVTKYSKVKKIFIEFYEVILVKMKSNYRMKCYQIIEKRALKHIPRTKYDISFWLPMVAKVFIQ